MKEDFEKLIKDKLFELLNEKEEIKQEKFMKYINKKIDKEFGKF